MLGPNAGRHVTKVGSGFGYYEETPLAKGHLCYSIHGFSLHCNTAVNTHSRNRLLKLKTPWHDGTSHLLLTPSWFLEKLAAIVPPPHQAMDVLQAAP